MVQEAITMVEEANKFEEWGHSRQKSNFATLVHVINLWEPWSVLVIRWLREPYPNGSVI